MPKREFHVAKIRESVKSHHFNVDHDVDHHVTIKGEFKLNDIVNYINFEIAFGLNQINPKFDGSSVGEISCRSKFLTILLSTVEINSFEVKCQQ